MNLFYILLLHSYDFYVGYNMINMIYMIINIFITYLFHINIVL